MGYNLFRNLVKKEYLMKNILFFADPNSIHDKKWMLPFLNNSNYNCYLISRKIHQLKEPINDCVYLGSLDDYSIFKPWQNKKGSIWLNKLLNNYKIDLIHIFFLEPNILWVNKLPKTLPTIATSRGSDVLIGLRKFIESKKWHHHIIASSYKKALKKCHTIISTSHRQKDFLRTKYDVKQTIEVIRTGMNLKYLLPQSDDKNYIFFSRNMHPLYQHELALDAIELLPKNIQNEYVFIFIDKDSSEKEYVKKITERIDKSDVEIQFLKKLNPIEYFKMLSKSKLVVMTPISDGAPVSGMEALASGAMLVLPDIGYDMDLFEKAFFYKKGDANALTTKIQSALKAKQDLDLSKYKEKVDRNIQMSLVEKIYLKYDNNAK